MKSVRQLRLKADRMVEPEEGDPRVNRLGCLPPAGTAFYGEEKNLLSGIQPGRVLMSELERRYCFLGGEREAWIEYLLGCSLPHDVRDCAAENQVKAEISVSAVLKKDGHTQSKLIMAGAANFLWTDVKQRGSMGLGGSAAIRWLGTEDKEIEMAVLDESNSYSAVKTPRWLRFYFACPAVLAGEVRAK